MTETTTNLEVNRVTKKTSIKPNEIILEGDSGRHLVLTNNWIDLDNGYLHTYIWQDHITVTDNSPSGEDITLNFKDIATNAYVDNLYVQSKNYADQTIATALNGYATEAYSNENLNRAKDYADKQIAEAKLAITSEIPTTTSELTNDSGFITNAALTGYATTSDVSTAISSQTKET